MNYMIRHTEGGWLLSLDDHGLSWDLAMYVDKEDAMKEAAILVVRHDHGFKDEAGIAEREMLAVTADAVVRDIVGA